MKNIFSILWKPRWWTPYRIMRTLSNQISMFDTWYHVRWTCFRCGGYKLRRTALCHRCNQLMSLKFD